MASPKGPQLEFLDRMSDYARNHMIAGIGELLGTMSFLVFGLSGAQVANTIGQSGATDIDLELPRLLYIALAFSVSLMVNVWVFYRVSGGLFNPAVTFALCIAGALPASRGSALIIAQILGSIAASAIVKAIFPGNFAVQTALTPGTSVVQGFLIEAFLTYQLVYTIMMLAVEKHRSTFLAPFGIGASLFIAELSGLSYTGGSLNPARSFGPALVDMKFEAHHWIYWAGPALGGAAAAAVYRLLTTLGYETANPGQDDDGSRPTQSGASDWTDEGPRAAGNDEEGGRLRI